MEYLSNNPFVYPQKEDEKLNKESEQADQEPEKGQEEASIANASPKKIPSKDLMLGPYLYSNGSTYQGQFNLGRREGKGK